MNSKSLSPRFLVITGMILGAAALRLIPHYPNFTPIAAMALFGGAYFTKKKTAFVVPFAAMLLSDLVLGFHATIWAVYLSFALIVMIGFMLKEKVKISNVFLAAVSSAVLFFAVTNFAFWATGLMYPLTFSGLIESYVAAIPFFNYSLLGNLVYTGALFGLFELAQMKFPVLAKTGTV